MEKRGAGVGPERQDELAAKVDAVLSESLANPPSLDDLARQMFVSRTKLCCDYRDATGKSIGDRLTELRIEEAKRLLVESDDVIGKISSEVGYRFQSSFATAFKREVGKSPQRWRAENGRQLRS